MHVRSFMASVARGSSRVASAITLATILTAATTLSSAIAANGSVVYTYDALGRVSTANYDTGVIIIYSYDANGNRTQQVINVNTATLTWTLTYSPCTTNCWGSTVW
jgi:YD repeat-containing protein